MSGITFFTDNTLPGLDALEHGTTLVLNEANNALHVLVNGKTMAFVPLGPYRLFRPGQDAMFVEHGLPTWKPGRGGA